jgi:hypothetical protein
MRQHTYEEIQGYLESEGFLIEATSINNFKPCPFARLIEPEHQLAEVSKKALYQKKRYFPASLWFGPADPTGAKLTDLGRKMKGARDMQPTTNRKPNR